MGVGIIFRIALDPESPRDASFFLECALHGAIIGIGIGLTNLAFQRLLAPKLRRAPLLAEIVLWSLSIILGIALFFGLATLLVYGPRAAASLMPAIPTVLVITFGVALVASFFARISRLLGTRLLLDLLTGSYLRPQIERRIVLFLDLAGSTTLAEKFGEARIQQLIARFFGDIDDAFADAGAEVLGYAGDSVILAWRAQDRARNGRPVEGLVAARAAIEALAESYTREFGLVPAFRAGLHLGDVSVGEIGGRRRQVSLFGDTMNVAARLQGEAKTVPSGWIASAAYVANTQLPAGVTAHDIGPMPLRGRVEPVPAYALEFA
jgi:class 3 adenylate cyclase